MFGFPMLNNHLNSKNLALTVRVSIIYLYLTVGKLDDHKKYTTSDDPAMRLGVFLNDGSAKL